jgi:ABC-2 type transport system ATP-binding protein
MNTPNTLVFEDIYKSYGETMAVRGVSFETRRGEVLGLLGPNGAGKTTLMRMLMDIIRPDSGRIVLFGEPLARAHLDRVAYLPEERGLYNSQKVIDVMTYFGTLRGLTRQEARIRSEMWLDRIGLSETAAWQVQRLSKGMGQKVQIASTLLPSTELCVLDEPFSGLDPVNVRLVHELIGERREAGQTTILSTHQMDMVEALCDRVALIDKGALMEYGPVQEVRERYSLPEVRVSLDGPLPELPGVTRSTEEGNRTWCLLLGDGTTPDQILTELVHARVSVNRFERVLAPMEEVFVRVVQEGAS